MTDALPSGLFNEIKAIHGIDNTNFKHVSENYGTILIPLPFACKEDSENGLAITRFGSQYAVNTFYSKGDRFILDAIRKEEPIGFNVYSNRPNSMGGTPDLEGLMSNLFKYDKVIKTISDVENLKDIKYKNIYLNFVSLAYYNVLEQPVIGKWLPEPVLEKIEEKIKKQNNQEDAEKMIKEFREIISTQKTKHRVW